jgi:hypothetical protein
VVTIKFNITPVVNLLKERFDKLSDKEYLLRPVAFDLIDLMTQRIHIEGNGSDGNPIGEYSDGYMPRRIKFQRGPSRKVIVALTRAGLEQDWSVIATNQGYGIGFKNPYNLKKARWVEAIKNRVIFNLSVTEEEYAKAKINKLIDALK